MKLRRIVFAGLLGALGCEDAPARDTRIIVAVHADAMLAAELTRVTVSLYRPDALDATPMPRAFDLAPDGVGDGVREALPISFAITKGGSNELLLVVEGYEPGRRSPVVERKLSINFRADETRLVKVLLSDACYDKPCSALDSTCAPEDGTCGAVPRAEDEEFDRDVELDPPDSSVRDAGPDVDPIIVCSEDERDCADGAPRRCVDGAWVESTCGADQVCDAGACVDVIPDCTAQCTETCQRAQQCEGPCDGYACAHGVCVVRGGAAACVCNAGYELDDPHTCADIRECDTPAASVCQGSDPFTFSFTCEEQEPYYRCAGQLADYAWQDTATEYRFFPRTYAGPTIAPTRDPLSPNNVVFDQRTGLEWEEKLSAPLGISWADAMAHCRNVQVAGSGFRAPTYSELLALVNDDVDHPALSRPTSTLPALPVQPVAYDETLFPGEEVHDIWYWSSNSRNNSQSLAYIVIQVNGVGGLYSEKAVYGTRPTAIRCVRSALSR